MSDWITHLHVIQMSHFSCSDKSFALQPMNTLPANMFYIPTLL